VLTKPRLAVLALLALLVAAFLLHDQVEFEQIKARQHELEALYETHPVATVLAFFALYVVIATTSIPGGSVLTMGAGAIFGVALGALLVSFASSIGATFAFLISRYVLGDWVRARFGRVFSRIDQGIERDGALYLFLVRLVPAIPFMLVNIGMGLTRIRTFTYYWVSQAGMLAGTLLFANAGRRLSEMQSPSDVFSPQVVTAFLMLALLPLLAARIAGRFRRVS
jgi:uncharacterized membrane protein YdjX (TVP38/TMEM64 family)